MGDITTRLLSQHQRRSRMPADRRHAGLSVTGCSQTTATATMQVNDSPRPRHSFFTPALKKSDRHQKALKSTGRYKPVNKTRV
jgi:hypothetical protein